MVDWIGVDIHAFFSWFVYPQLALMMSLAPLVFGNLLKPNSCGQHQVIWLQLGVLGNKVFEVNLWVGVYTSTLFSPLVSTPAHSFMTGCPCDNHTLHTSIHKIATLPSPPSCHWAVTSIVNCLHLLTHDGVPACSISKVMQLIQNDINMQAVMQCSQV